MTTKDDDLVERWRRHASHLRGMVIERERRIYRLEALIDKHNDECRECPVLELQQDGEPQASDEQAGTEVDLSQDQKDDVEQQDDEREQRPNPRSRKRVGRH